MTRAHVLSIGLILALAAVAPRPAETEKQSSGSQFDVTYLANEGFLVESSGKRVLIDALFGPGISGYSAVPPDERTNLERGSGRYADVSVALATHYHGDHFDPTAVARFLETNPQATFVSTPQAIARLREAVSDDSRVLARARAVYPAEGASELLEIDGIRIDVLNLHHGRRVPVVENLGFVVTIGELRFLHFGDTAAKMETFEPYLERLNGTDLALLPFWFLSSEWRAGLVRDHIQPAWIVAAHTPEPTAPAGHFGRWGNYQNLVEVMRAAFPDAQIPTDPGERFRFGAAARAVPVGQQR